MCFILNIFNSCKTSAKKPSNSCKTPNSQLVSPKHQQHQYTSRASSLATHKPHDQNSLDLNTKAHCTSRSFSGDLSEKLRSKLNLAEFDSDETNDFEISPSDLLKAKLLSKSPLINRKYPNKKSLLDKECQELIDSNLKYKSISDYCNECGYYCCECDNVTNYSSSKQSIGSSSQRISSILSKLSKESSLNEEEFYKDLNSPYLEYPNRFPTTPTSIAKNSFNQLDSSFRNKEDTNFVSYSSSPTSQATQKTLKNLESMASLNDNTTDGKLPHFARLTLKEQANADSKSIHIPIGTESSTLNLSMELNHTMNPPQRTQNVHGPGDLSLSIIRTSKRPSMGISNMKKSELGSPQLGLEKISMKKNKFIFDKSELRLQDDDVLSRELEKEKKDTYNRQNKIKQSKAGKISIASNKVFEFKEGDLVELGQIGNGEFGTVHKALHTPSQTIMAIKRIGPTVGNQVERKKVLKEIDFVLNEFDNEFVVKFYGVKFNNEPADCLICMELMDTSMEKFYKYVYGIKKEEIPEPILGKVVMATVSALDYLKERHSIIHRDVKPSNMLVNKQGEIKMCDFGISGKLVDSIAASRDAGCQLYMAPERIDPSRAEACHGYDVRSDIWSLGISMYELATGKFPYPAWTNIFNQLSLVVQGEAPRLKSERLSKEFCHFANTCLTKDDRKRPKYRELKQHPLFKTHLQSNVNISEYLEPYINEMLSITEK